MKRAIVTVIGKDQPGIIYKVSKVLFDSNVNILDINQTIMQDVFTMIMLADIEKCNISFDLLVGKMNEIGGSLGLSIHTQHEDIFNSMHRI